MESNTSEAAASSTCSSSDMYPQQQQQATCPAVVQDFKMPSSLGEVQRIIGLSLSKIQMGRNQRGGLPLHKNLLVATVLNKARDLYMQETMYMNYKMMTGQFAAAASAASSSSSGGSNNSSQMHEAMHHHSQHYHHHYGMVGSACNNVNAETDDDMEPNVEANEADYDEDSESDVEDECDVTSVPSVASSSHNNHNQNTYPSSMPSSMLLCNLPSSMAAPNASSPHAAELSASQPLPNSNVANGQAPDAAAVASIGLLGHHPGGIGIGINVNEQTPSASDEGFIDEPDCDCDARNFSTSESRVPFQYCYHCAPFHPSSGRGPTLVPSQSPTPNSSSAPSAATSCPSCPSSSSTCQPENSNDAATVTADPAAAATALIYDMDSQTTKDSSEGSNLRGTKRRRNSSEDETDEFSQVESGKKRRESTETNDNLETSLLNSSQDESGYQSPSDSSLNEVFHPAFRGSPSCTPSSTPEQSPSNATVVQTESQVASINGQNTMEIDQITSLVSIFSFGQHIMAAAAKAATQKREFQEEEEEEDEVSSSNKTSKKQTGSKKSESSEDSDSESDTSSDSGHSSDDHEAAKEEDSNAVTVTKLTRSVSTPDLCAVTSVAVSTTSMASEAPPCVEVASL